METHYVQYCYRNAIVQMYNYPMGKACNFFFTFSHEKLTLVRVEGQNKKADNKDRMHNDDASRCRQVTAELFGGI